jgi:hypothetical protein
MRSLSQGVQLWSNRFSAGLVPGTKFLLCRNGRLDKIAAVAGLLFLEQSRKSSATGGRLNAGDGAGKKWAGL